MEQPALHTYGAAEMEVGNDHSLGMRRKRKHCAHEECTKSAVSKGLCSSHGGGARCKEPDCNKLMSRRGYCGTHATAKGFPNQVVDKRRGRYKRKNCKIPNCVNLEYGNSNGCCTLHGGGAKKCSDVTNGGCTRVAIFGGLCLRHANARRSGTAQAADPASTSPSVGGNSVGLAPSSSMGINAPGPDGLLRGVDMGGGEEHKRKKARLNIKKCKVEDCPKHIVMVGFCMAHAKEHSSEVPDKYKCQEKVGPEGEVCGVVCLRFQRCYQHSTHTRCKYEGCGKHDVFRGYCKSHGMMMEPVDPNDIREHQHPIM